MGQAICMYSTLAVSASYIYKGISKLRIYTHLQGLLYSLYCRYLYRYVYAHCFVGVQSHVLQGVTWMYRCQPETGWRCRLRLGSLWSSSNNPVFYGHFDPGYANIRQPHIFKCQIEGKNLVLHSSNYGMMQIHSLTKLGKSVVQKSSLEPQIYFLLSKVCSLAILSQYRCGMGKIVTEIL